MGMRRLSRKTRAAEAKSERIPPDTESLECVSPVKAFAVNHTWGKSMSPERGEHRSRSDLSVQYGFGFGTASLPAETMPGCSDASPAIVSGTTSIGKPEATVVPAAPLKKGCPVEFGFASCAPGRQVGSDGELCPHQPAEIPRGSVCTAASELVQPGQEKAERNDIVVGFRFAPSATHQLPGDASEALPQTSPLSASTPQVEGEVRKHPALHFPVEFGFAPSTAAETRSAAPTSKLDCVSFGGDDIERHASFHKNGFLPDDASASKESYPGVQNRVLPDMGKGKCSTTLGEALMDAEVSTPTTPPSISSRVSYPRFERAFSVEPLQPSGATCVSNALRSQKAVKEVPKQQHRANVKRAAELEEPPQQPLRRRSLGHHSPLKTPVKKVARPAMAIESLLELTPPKSSIETLLPSTPTMAIETLLPEPDSMDVGSFFSLDGIPKHAARAKKEANRKSGERSCRRKSH
jgi:hypothetical protein